MLSDILICCLALIILEEIVVCLFLIFRILAKGVYKRVKMRSVPLAPVPWLFVLMFPWIQFV